MTPELRIGECAIDRAGSRIVRADGVTHVEPRAMDVLIALAERACRTASRDELIAAVWGHPHVSDEALSQCVCVLRRALGDTRGAPRYIETIPKRGYRLLARVDGMPLPARHLASTPIAILPFVNLSGNPVYDHLADGLTELLIAFVAALPSLRVVSRTSSMQYKNTRLRISQIAHELGVTRIVEGSVLVSGRTAQAVIQLIDSVTDTHLFAQSFTRELADPLRLQNDIAASMASAVGAAIAC
jgi:TolB-like protein